jgi:predicted transcriptional regulator
MQRGEKTRKTVQVNAWLDGATAARLKSIADERKWTVSWTARNLIRESLDRHEAEQKQKQSA